MNILIFVHYYLPGYKAGGPLRTIANMVAALGDQYHFYIVCADRDFGDREPYRELPTGRWTPQGKAMVWYCPPGTPDRKMLKSILDGDTRWDLIYLQSFWDIRYSLLPVLAWRLRIGRSVPLLLAPRGEFGEGAIRIKQTKKRWFLRVVKFLGIFRGAAFHCSSGDEERDLRREFSSTAKVFIALDIPDGRVLNVPSAPPPGEPAGVALCFISRIVPKKNLHYALKVLKEVRIPIRFDIYGTLEDEDYWSRCQKLISQMPPNIRVAYRGEVHHHQVLETFAGYDLFFFPTGNENFGHVIHESLRAGTPVLCSDQTPWHELGSRRAGWEIPLATPDAFVKIITDYAAMSSAEQDAMRRAALQYGIDIAGSEQILADNRKMFDSFKS